MILRCPKKQKDGQAILEYTAGMVVVCLLINGMIAVFRWGMMDMAERRFDHDAVLRNALLNTEEQLNPDFHQVRPIE